MKAEEKRAPTPYWLEIIYGILMLVGLILAFFYVQIGGVLVGLAVGLSFYKKILIYLSGLSNLYNSEGLFKTMLALAAALYLLIAVPTFVIALIVGFVVISFFSRVLT